MLMSGKLRSSSMIWNVLERSLGFVSSRPPSTVRPSCSSLRRLRLLMNAKDARLLIATAGWRSSQGKPVRRSLRHSRMCTPGWSGKMMAVVCNARCKGEVSTLVGIGKCLLWTRPSMTARAASTCALPSSVSAASWRCALDSAARLAAATRSTNSALDGSWPARAASSAASMAARSSSMLCTASPWRISHTTFLAMTLPGNSKE
mmetsp:Transcript_87183/g.244028  ORF Transcript_87183/g.244028 Transcript_87183/m.244028 type:complete len:204 (+) Transcript_87183:150-761(+)